MKRNVTAFLVLILLSAEAPSQIVYGRLIDDTFTPVRNAILKLYAAPYVYDSVSDTLGAFTFTLNLTDVEDGNLPTGYAVSNNFPNPFNPKTRIGISLPSKGNVRLEVFNALGELVAPVTDQAYDAGTHFIDVDLHGLANGIYISRVTIDENYVVVRKMALIYGSQHLNAGSGGSVNKTFDAVADILLDSLVVWTDFGTKTFTSLPAVTADTLNLGDLVIERMDCPPEFAYEGVIYHGIQVGDQCWFKENLNAGTMIPGTAIMHDNGVIEKYCYNDDTTYCHNYGALYQWDEAMEYNTAPGSRGICPPGWHMPSREEYEVLLEAAGFDGNALKKTGWGTGNGAGTNTTGFSAILGGRRYSVGDFGSFGNLGVYWTSTEYSGFYAIYMHLYNTGKIAGLPDLSKKYGFSVRCIKD